MWFALAQAASAHVANMAPVVQAASARVAADMAPVAQAASAHLANVVPLAYAALSTSAPEAVASLTAAGVASAAVNPSIAPGVAGVVAASLTSIVVAKVAHTSSVLSNTFGMDSAMHVTEFAKHVRLSDIKNKAHVKSLALMQSTSLEELVVRQTGATQGHRFVVAAIELESDGSSGGFRTFARVDFWGRDSFKEHSISQVVMLSDDAHTLQEEARELGRLDAGPSRGPTLGEFASLLEVIHARTPEYNILVHNCYWMSEMIMFCVARRNSEAWLAGSARPTALARWIKCECNATACILDMAFDDGPLDKFKGVASAALGVYRWGLANLAPGNARMAPVDDDISQTISAWRDVTMD